MAEVQWREIKWGSAHQHVGKPVRVRRKDGHEFSAILQFASPSGVNFSGEIKRVDVHWDEASLFYAWYPTDNVRLTGDPLGIRDIATGGTGR